MHETWMKSGQSGPAHWIKLAGSRYYTTACQTTLAREAALGVATSKLAIASAPGRFYLRPKAGDVCPLCEQKAKAQA